jgi:NADH-quinone oxidoreductase subunit C
LSSADGGAGPTTGTASSTTPVDDRQQALLQDLTSRLGDAVVGSHVRSGDLWVRVRPDAWLRAARECRSMSFDYFCYLSGIDWMPHTWPNPKVIEGAGVTDTGDDELVDADEEALAEPEPDTLETGGIVTGYGGGDTRFQVLARLYSTGRHIGVTLKADLDDETPQIESWISVYPGADWSERETWEMYGFDFIGHPNLVHLYLPGEFEGFPLRKDFPLLAREVKPWPGLVDVEPMPPTADVDGADADAAAAAPEDASA